MRLLLLLALLLPSCATTTFYKDGIPIARFQGDMTDMAYAQSAKGAVKWTAKVVDHSHATVAGGQAFAKGTLSLGTAVATSGLPTIINK